MQRLPRLCDYWLFRYKKANGDGHTLAKKIGTIPFRTSEDDTFSCHVHCPLTTNFSKLRIAQIGYVRRLIMIYLLSLVLSLPGATIFSLHR